MAQWKALLTRLEDDNSMNKELVDDIRRWIEVVQNYQDFKDYEGDVEDYERYFGGTFIRGQATSKEFWINWKKKLVEAGNAESDRIDWRRYKGGGIIRPRM